jgi:hypothetical protein
MHSANHNARFTNVRRHPQLRQIYFQYHELYSRSLGGRYECASFSVQDVQMLYSLEYMTIKRHLQPLLGFAF